ncbi:endonuclease/exonuclease/phosphatase family protein [Mumia sp. Pv 4-285]|uniref:endonuclease/exonuclease/phosphatase family protein n=1 Tax=Mumia qirimensis TaxID=3234852 RepID=UPI00351CBB8B
MKTSVPLESWLTRVVAVAALLLAAVLQMTGAAEATSSARDDGRTGNAARVVDVMTFNIHHGAGADDLVSLERIADVIRDSGADVVGLQEVDRHFSARSGWADQATELADLLGYEVAFGANIDRDPPAPGQPRIQYGTAILSKHPIVGWSNTWLARTGNQEQRGLLTAEIDVRGTRLTVLNTHLAASSQPDRLAQTAQIAAAVDPRQPTVLFGDLNALPDAPEIATLNDVLTDAWTVSGRGEGLTYPTDVPKSRIDYVYTTRSAKPLRTRVLTEVTEASDHLPVVSRVLVKDRQGTLVTTR